MRLGRKPSIDARALNYTCKPPLLGAAGKSFASSNAPRLRSSIWSQVRRLSSAVAAMLVGAEIAHGHVVVRGCLDRAEVEAGRQRSSK